MTYAPRPNEFTPYFEAAVPATTRRPAPPRGLLRRLIGAMIGSRERQVDREVAQFIARTGGRLTDETERQITDRLITGRWWR